MKLSESKLRELIREEVNVHQLSQEYGNVADEAFDKAEEDPDFALTHIAALASVADGLALELELSELGRSKVKDLLDTVGELQRVVRNLKQEVSS